MVQRILQSRSLSGAIAMCAIVVSGAVAVAWGYATVEPQRREIHITARQYAYEPGTLEVQQGDTLVLTFSSLDVIHGWYLEAYGIDLQITPASATFRQKDAGVAGGYREVEEIRVIADNAGKFRYRCSHTCGSMHPFMQGELVVGPNSPLHAGIGMTVGILIVGIVFVGARAGIGQRGPSNAGEKV